MTELSAERTGIRVLGPVECRSEPPASLGGPKQRLLLAVLVVHTGRVVSAEVLLDALWGEHPPADARRTLQVFVSRLRGALRPIGGEIRWRDSGYLLTVPPGAVDARTFERHVAEAAGGGVDQSRGRDLLAEALALWRGTPFGDLADHPALAPERDRLTELRLRATEGLADLDLAEGRHESIVGDLRRLMSEHPLSESLCARLMLALHRCGRRGEALTLFDQMRRTLSEELGVDPSRLLQQLHLLLLDDDPSLDDLSLDDLAATQDGTAAHGPVPGSVAVLPLHVISDSSEVAALAAGLHTDLITELSRLEPLTVIGRTSVLGYSGTGHIPRIARELGVATVVEGSLQGSGSRFGLTVGLVDGASGTQGWTVTYDDDLTAESLFSVQRDLAREIAARLSSQLVPERGQAAEPARTTSLDAYRLVAAARVDYDTKTEPSLRAAVGAYRAATEIDPSTSTPGRGCARHWWRPSSTGMATGTCPYRGLRQQCTVRSRSTRSHRRR